MKKIIFFILILFFSKVSLANNFEDIKNKETSYLDFILLKLENRLIQRHGLLRKQVFAVRIQYQNVGSQVEFLEKENKIIISIIGIMDKKRYEKKKYVPKISDCNIVRNILLYGKHGYSIILQKRNKYLTDEDMRNIFVDRFLNNLSLSPDEKEYILDNT